jgi:hypothetical protein
MADRQLCIHLLTSFEVGNHDFTKTSISPSVSFLMDIPDDITGSWYAGQVYVLCKDTVLELLSPSQHGREIVSILREGVIDYIIIFVNVRFTLA